MLEYDGVGQKSKARGKTGKRVHEYGTALSFSEPRVAPVWAQIVYYDGQFDDSRLAVTLACTAARAGATVLNYAEVTRLLKVMAPCPAIRCYHHDRCC
jgi:glycerol-3-phosphate dehydrogenase